MDHISEFASMHFGKYGRKLILCKKFKKVLQRTIVMGKDDLAIPDIKKNSLQKMGKCAHFREIDVSGLMPTGW